MFKKFKKISVVLLAILVIGSSVFAQGQSDTKDENVELVYWSHYGQSPAFVDSFAEAANKALKELGYDNVTCKSEVIEFSGFESKYLSAFAGGVGPDMFVARPANWAINGGTNPVAAPLTAEAKAAWDNALPGLYSADSYFRGESYGFPAEGGSIQFIFLNKDAMEEIGLDADKDYPKTMTELRALAKKLTKYDANGKIIRSGYAPRFLGGGAGVTGKFLSLYHQYGASILNEDLTKAEGYVNSEASKRAFQDYQDMVLVDRSISLEFGSPESAFQSGQTAMMTREAWFVQDCYDKAPNINFGVYPIVSEDVSVASTEGSAGWSTLINAKSDHLDLCMELFTELAKPEYDVIMHESSGYPPVNRFNMGVDNEYFMSLPYAQATIDSLDRPEAPIYSTIPEYNEISPMFGNALVSVLNGADVDSTLDKLAKEIEVILNN